MNSKLQSVIDKIVESTDTYQKKKAIYKACPYSVSKILDTLHKPFEKEKKAQEMVEKYFDDPNNRYYHMSYEDIINQWDEAAKTGRENGKLLDKYIGMVLEKKESKDILDKFTSSINEVAGNKCKSWHRFYDSNIQNKIEFVGRELMLYDEKLKVNGRLDALFLKGDILLLIDWKNNDKISTNNPFEKCKGPLFEYDASDLNLYTVQVYIYAYILITKYHLDDIKIVPLIAQIGQDDFNLYSPMIPYSDTLVSNIISYAKSEINKQIEDKK